MKPTRLSLLRAASAMAILSSPAAHAVGGNWNVNNLGNWSLATNWSSNPTVPGTAAGDAVNLQFNITAARIVTIDTTSRTVGDLNIGDPTATLFGYTLAASGGAVLNLDGTAATAATVDFTAAIANTISAPIALVDNGVFRSNVNAGMTLSGVISGVGKTLTFNNDTNGAANAASSLLGQFVVTGANTYSGGTSISDSRVFVGTNATALGSGTVTIASGGQAMCASALTLANSFSIAGNGWVETTAGQPIGALRLDSGAVVSGPVTMTANAALGSNVGTGTVSGVISGPFNLSKRGPGRINLSGTNTYGGLTSVTNGILAATKPAAFPGFSTLHGNTVASGTTLAAFVGGAGEFTSADVDTLRTNTDFNTGSFLGLDPSNAPGGSFTYGSNITDASGVAGTLGLNKLGSGVLVLSGTNTYTGTTLVSAGALSIATTAALPGYATNGSYSVANGATLAVGNAVSDGDVTTLLGTTNFVLGSSLGFDTSAGDRTSTAILANTSLGALNLNKLGANSLTLTGANTYTGSTTVSAGTLVAAGGSAAAGNIVVGNSTANAVLNVPLGGTMTGGTITAGTANGSVGAVNVTGGTLSLATVDASTDAISFGGGEGGYGAFTISDGTFTQQRFMFGGIGTATTLGGVGVGLITGGTVNSAGWLILARHGASTGILTVNGGLLNHAGASNDLAVGLNGSGRAELNVGGGLLDNTGRRVTFSGGTSGGFHWSGTGLVNLNGGTLLTNSIAYDTAVSPFSPNANSYVNFGGGTLKAATSSASFFPAHTPTGTGVSQVYVNGAFGSFTGGAVIDTNGFDPTISANFLAPTGNGVTGLTIDNAGSGYVGAPAVKILDGGLPSTATAYAVVGTDAAVPATFGKITSVVITNPGVIVGTPTVSLVGGGGTGAAVSVASTGPNTSGGFTKAGAGQLTLTGNSTYTGLTSVSSGTLVVSGTGTLAASSGLSVSSGAAFFHLPTAAATTLSFGPGSTLNLANNSTIGGTFESTVAVSGMATVTGTVNLAMSGAFTSGTPYTVLNAASGLNGATYNVLNPSNFTYTTSATSTAVTITPTFVTPLINAYWIGGFAGLPGVWSASDGSGTSNWTTDGLGTATPLVPGSTVNVFFSDASAAAVNQAAMSLGSNMSVGSLTFNSTNPATLLTTDSSVLSITNGLTVNAPAGAVTLSANIATTAAQSWTNNSANPLTTGLVSNGANLLTLSGSGNTTIGNFNGGTGGLTVDSTGFTALSAATLAGAQTWTNNSVNILTVGAIANASFGLTLAGTGNFDLGGVVSGTGALTKAGGGTATLSAANTYTGATTVAEGTLTLSGPRIGNSGILNVSNVAGQSAILNIVNGTYAFGANGANIGNAPTTAATGTVNQTGGAISFTGGNQVLVGQNTVGNQGVYNMSGGSITTFASATRGVMLGVNTNPAPGPASGGGTFNLSGTAVLNMVTGGNSLLQIGRSDAVANNTTNAFNQTGGTATVGILAMGGGATAGSTGVSSTLTLTGGTFSANSFTVLSAGGTNDSFINIGGTADVTLPAFPTVRGASSTATLNLDGGTLRPSAASATYISGLTNAFIQDGGANFDVPTGRNITVSQALLTDGVSLGGGLSKSGAGVLTLSGANTYTGLTTVTGGGLVARNLTSLPGIATLHQISLSGASTLTLGVGGIGEFASTDVDTVLTNADFNTGTALGFDTANAAGGFTYATNISNASGVAGTNLGVAKSGANTLVLSGANTYSGPTTITGGILEIAVSNNLGDASPTNSINLAGGTFSSGASAFTLNNSRAVNITAAAGFRSESGGVLTIDTDLANGANSIALTGAGSIIVNGVIGTGVTPTGAITIGSSTQPANVTLNGNNLFTGNVTLPASNVQPFAVLTVTNSGALGVGPKTVTSQGGGEIHLQNNITLASNISFNTSGSQQQNGNNAAGRAVIYNDSGNNTINGNIGMNSGNGDTIISSDSGLLTLNGNLSATAVTRQLRVRGTGNGVINGVIANGSTVNMPVLKDGGSGTWTFNGANTYTGATTVSAGTLALGNAAALGTGAATVNGGSLDLGGQTVANAVTVNAAGTLTGSGAAGAATLAGSVTPGGSGNGLITVASATVAATSNLALQLGGTGVRGTNYDAVTVNSALTLDGTITVTLNGLVPAATQTFDLIDSTGAINVTNFNVGTDLILPPLGTGLAWNTSDFATTGQITIEVDADPFTAWATANSVEGGKGGDEDGDGTSNLLEFATNADPQSGSSGARVYGLVHPIGGTPVLTYTVATRAAAIFAANGSRQEATKDFVKYSIEGTNDLSIWNSVVVTEVTGGDATAVRASIVPALPTLDSGWEWHTFRTDDNTAVDPTDFIRLNVTEAP